MLVSIICIYVFIEIYINHHNEKVKAKYSILTTEQKLKDFDYLYNVLKEEFPYFEEKKKKTGYDWLVHKRDFEKSIKKSKTDVDYFIEMTKILEKLDDGHTNIMDNSYYNNLVNKKVYIFPKDKLDQQEAMVNKNSTKKTYSNVEKILKKMYKSPYEILKEKVLRKLYAPYDKFYETKILKDKKVAYIRLSSMSMDDDMEIEMTDFLYSVKDYPYLIIDIIGNSGGFNYVWEHNLVEPLISKNINLTKYNFYKQKNSVFYDLDEIKDFKNTENLPINKYKYFSKIEQEYTDSNFIGFEGKIFLLTDGQSFSASDQFSYFTKKTKFATIVGEPTGGGGSEYRLISLPNSGLMLRVTNAGTFNVDKSSNGEKGISPDVYVKRKFKYEGLNFYRKRVLKEVNRLIESDEKK